MGFKKLAYKILSLVNYFHLPGNLNRLPKKVYQEPYYVYFNERESHFLKLSAGTFNYNPDYTNGYLQKPLYTATLKHVTILGNSGALVLQNQPLAESVFDMLRLSISPAFRFPALMLNQNKSGVYSSVMHLPWAQTSNFHWFFDCLPRLYILIQTTQEPINLIVNAGLPAFQLETLNFLLKDYPQFNLVFIRKNQKWTVEKFIFPGFITNHNSGYLPIPVAAFLREKIWAGYGIPQGGTANRIYISRRKAAKRKILNEPELEPILVKHNFKIIHAEDLTYQQQVQFFYQAKYIVAPHGAGLTNMLFSQNCSILEMQAGDVIKTHYFLAAKSLGHTYEYLLGSPSDAKFNFTIDPLIFSEKLQKMFQE
jgi:hypothetical protein